MHTFECDTCGATFADGIDAGHHETTHELGDTRLEVRYGGGGRLRVEFALTADGRLMGRYPPSRSDWTVREADEADEEHVRIIGAIREVLEQYDRAAHS